MKIFAMMSGSFFKGIITIIFILCPFMLCGQSFSLRGNIQRMTSDGKTEALPYANIMAFAVKDTTRYVKGGISDQQGNYVLEGLLPGKYIIKASFVGHKEEKTPVDIAQVENNRLDFILKEDTQVLSEVTVESNLSYQDKNKKIEMFSPTQVKSSQNGLDLVAQTPQLYLDPIQQKLQDRSGNSLTLLINGIAASSEELRNIPPEKILRVEYYEVPSARYAFSGKVVDIITKRLDAGYSCGFGLSHAVSTGFANDNLYLSRVWGNNQLSLNYDLGWRDYKHNDQTRDYEFMLQDRHYAYNQKDRGKFDYATHNINLRYNYNKPDKFVLQFRFTPFYRTDNSTADSEYSIVEGEEQSTRSGYRKNHSDIFKPALSSYANIKFSETKELSVEVVGTLFQTNQDNLNEQYDTDKEKVFENFLYADSRKKSVIAEAIYQQNFNRGHSLLLGARTSISRSDANIRNILNEKEKYRYKIRNNSQVAYVQYARSVGNFYYTFAALCYNLYSKNSQQKYHTVQFAPFAQLNYKINDNHSLSLWLKSYPDSPSISHMTRQASLIIDNVVSYGNPGIEPSQSYSLNFSYSLNSKYINAYLSAFANRTYDPIAQYYQDETFENKPVMALKWENGDRYDQMGISPNLSIYPFGNRDLFIGVTWNYQHYIYQSRYMKKVHHNYHGVFFNLSYRKKEYGINGYYRIPGKYYRPLYITEDENNSGIDVFYNIGNWRLSASWMFMFNASSYSTETQPGSPLYNRWTSRISDNKNMITLGVSWNFNKGKTMKVNKNISNNDNDAGIL